jgi:hypothetical protein
LPARFALGSVGDSGRQQKNRPEGDGADYAGRENH